MIRKIKMKQTNILFFFFLVAILVISTEIHSVVLPPMDCQCEGLLGTSLTACDCGELAKAKISLSGVSYTCSACRAGRSCDGNIKEELCPAGTFGRGGECAIKDQKCPKCPLGSYSSTGASTCIDAPAGTYVSARGASSPFNCPANTYSTAVGATSSDTCIACENGATSDPGSTRCSCGPGFRDDDETNACVQCPAGTRSVEDRSECVECSQAGTFSTAGSSECSSCPAGTWSNTPRAGECTPASIGHYVPEPGATSQLPCRAGTFMNTTGASSCNSCPSGSITQGDTRDRCFPCETGTYEVQNVQCSVCPAGTFANVTGLDACYSCAAGYVTQGSTRDRCFPCGLGTFEVRNTHCDVCQPGSFANATALSKCYSCEKGTYQPANSSDRCIQAAQGHYVPNEGSSSQLPCAPGSFSQTLGLSKCNFVPKGHFQPDSGQTNFRTCVPGTYAASEGKANCDVCRPGTAMSPTKTGSTAVRDCVQCPAGSYSSANAQTECASCPRGTASSAGAMHESQCYSCARGFYADQERSAECTRCPQEGSSTPNVRSTSVSDCYLCGGPQAPGMIAIGSGGCSYCEGGAYIDVPGSSSCKRAGYGMFTLPGASFPVPCPVGYHCPTNGCDSKCLYCGDLNGYSTQEGSSSCTICERGNAVNKNATGCFTTTLSQSSSHQATPSNSHLHTESNEHSASTSIELSHGLTNSSSLSQDTETKSRHSVSVNLTKSKSKTSSENATESIHRVSPTRTESTTNISRGFKNTESLSSSTSQTNEQTVTDANLSPTHEQTATQPTPSEETFTSSPSLSQLSETLTEQIFPKKAPLGLSAKQVEEMKQVSSVSTAVAGAASAPAAMAMSRGSAVLALIGCEEKNPATGNFYAEDRVPFPISLIPGVGFGDEKGAYQRGSIVGFVVVFFIMMFLAFLNRESIGISQGSRTDEKAKTPTQKKKEDWEIDDTSNNSNNSDDKNNNNNTDNTAATDNEENPILRPNAAVNSNIPQLIFAVLASALALWCPQAGLLLSTMKMEDILLAVVPLTFIFAFIFYVNVRLYRSVSDEKHGIFFTPSHLLRRSDEVGCFGCIVPRKTASFLNSPLGRFLFVGNSFWTRRKGEENQAAHRVLQMLGSQLQKFRGVVKVANFVETENPFEEEELTQFEKAAKRKKEEAEKQKKLEKKQKGKKNGLNANLSQLFGTKNSVNTNDDDDLLLGHQPSSARNNNTNSINNEEEEDDEEEEDETSSEQQHQSQLTRSQKEFLNPQWDWREREEIPVEPEEGADTWASRVAPYYLLISWLSGASVGLLEGYALGTPTSCPWIARVIMIENLLSAIFFLWCRPFVVPLRNYVMGALEITICTSSVLAVIFLMTNEENPHNDPDIQKRLDFQSSLAAFIQVLLTLVGNAVSFIMVSTTFARILLFKKSHVSLATQEEMWANKKFLDQQEEEDNNDNNDEEMLLNNPTTHMHNNFSASRYKNTTDLDDLLLASASSPKASSTGALPKKLFEKKQKKEDDAFLEMMLEKDEQRKKQEKKKKEKEPKKKSIRKDKKKKENDYVDPLWASDYF